jgi:hypothetical protein
MDPLTYGPDRLRRFYQVKRRGPDHAKVPGMTVRDFMTGTPHATLRGLIRDTVTTFVPPQLPLRSGPVTCTGATVALHRSGFHIGGRLHTSTDQPVAVALGFCLNDEHRWAVLIGALNHSRESWATSRSRFGVFGLDGGSLWLREHYDPAVSQGLTIRLHHELDLNKPLRDFVGGWIGTLGGVRLDPLKMFSMTDIWRDVPPSPLDESRENTYTAADQESETLSLEVSLVFE